MPESNIFSETKQAVYMSPRSGRNKRTQKGESNSKQRTQQAASNGHKEDNNNNNNNNKNNNSNKKNKQRAKGTGSYSVEQSRQCQ